jgi:hypothetical protein
MPPTPHSKKKRAPAAAATAVRVGGRRAGTKSKVRARVSAADLDVRRLRKAFGPIVRKMVAEAIEDQLDSVALAESLREPGRVTAVEMRKQLGL